MSESGPSAPKRRKVQEESYRAFIDTSRAVRDIKKVDKEINKLHVKEAKEHRQIEIKYNCLRWPFYRRRSQLTELIPKFWPTALFNEPCISDIIHEVEKPCLSYLEKLEVVEENTLGNGFRINFTFKHDNPYLVNNYLVKDFQLDAKGKGTSTSTPILWKSDMDLSKTLEEISAQRRSRGEDPKTFFTWFSDNKDGIFDFIGHVIRDTLWPNLLYYFSGNDDDESETSEEGEESEDLSSSEEDVSSDEESDSSQKDDVNEEEEDSNEVEDHVNFGEFVQEEEGSSEDEDYVVECIPEAERAEDIENEDDVDEEEDEDVDIEGISSEEDESSASEEDYSEEDDSETESSGEEGSKIRCP